MHANPYSTLTASILFRKSSDMSLSLLFDLPVKGISREELSYSSR